MLRSLALVLVTLVAAVILAGWASTARFYAGWRGFPQPGRTEADTVTTTRLFAGDLPSFAALASRAAYPGGGLAGTPGAVILAPADDWRWAAALVPLGNQHDAPILYYEPDQNLADATRGELQRLAVEAKSAGARLDALVAGPYPVAEQRWLDYMGYRREQLPGDDPVSLAAQLLPRLSYDRILFVEQARPDFALPALAWSAYAGDPVLFVDKSSVPDATRDALQGLDQPPKRMYVLVHDKAAKSKVTGALKKYGHAKVTRIHSDHAAGLAVRVATWRDKYGFGWGLPLPEGGQDVLLGRSDDAGEVIAALSLVRTSVAGPLLIAGGNRLPTTTMSYLWKASPASSTAGSSNHAWIIGDEAEVSERAQADVDAALRGGSPSRSGAGLSDLEAIALGWAAVGIAAAGWALYFVNTRRRAFMPPWRAAWPAALVLLGPPGAAAFVWRCLRIRGGSLAALLDSWVGARAFDLGPFLAALFLASALGTPALTAVPNDNAGFASSVALQEAIAAGAAVAGIILYQRLLREGRDDSEWWQGALSAAAQVAALAAAGWGAWWFRLSYLPAHDLPSETQVAWWAAALFAGLVALAAALPFEAALRLVTDARRPAGTPSPLDAAVVT